jgi:hypothetical protein
MANDKIPDAEVSVQKVKEWLDEHRWDQKYMHKRYEDAEKNDEIWLKYVDGATLLKDIFKALFGSVNVFNKMTHGIALTKWLIENKPDELSDIADMIEKLLPTPVA